MEDKSKEKEKIISASLKAIGDKLLFIDCVYNNKKLSELKDKGVNLCKLKQK